MTSQSFLRGPSQLCCPVSLALTVLQPHWPFIPHTGVFEPAAPTTWNALLHLCPWLVPSLPSCLISNVTFSERLSLTTQLKTPLPAMLSSTSSFLSSSQWNQRFHYHRIFFVLDCFLIVSLPLVICKPDGEGLSFFTALFSVPGTVPGTK